MRIFGHILTLLFRRIAGTQTTDVLFFPFYSHRSLHLPCRYRRDGAEPGRYFQVFLRRRFARYLSLFRCLCPTGFTTALRPCSSGISCKNVRYARTRVSLWSSLDSLIESVNEFSQYNTRIDIALIFNNTERTILLKYLKI